MDTSDCAMSRIAALAELDQLDLLEPSDLTDPIVRGGLQCIVSNPRLVQSYRDKAESLLSAANSVEK